MHAMQKTTTCVCSAKRLLQTLYPFIVNREFANQPTGTQRFITLRTIRFARSSCRPFTPRRKKKRLELDSNSSSSFHPRSRGVWMKREKDGIRRNKYRKEKKMRLLVYCYTRNLPHLKNSSDCHMDAYSPPPSTSSWAIRIRFFWHQLFTMHCYYNS